MNLTSEPKVLVLGGSFGRWHASTRVNDASTMNGIEAWVYAFNGEYDNGIHFDAKRINEYDIVIGNTNGDNLENFLRMLGHKHPETKFVALVEGCATDYLTPKPNLREVFDGADLVNSINHYSTDLFRRMTSTRVEYIGIPYPAESIRKLALPFDQRKRQIFLTPRLLNRWTEYFCVQDLGVPYYGYERILMRKWRNLWKNLTHLKTLDKQYFIQKADASYHDPKLTIRKEGSLTEYFMDNRDAYAWLNLDYRYTWGRYVLDAAALQIPIVATRSTGHAEHFFPQTMVENEFAVEQTRELLKRLLIDSAFYEEVATVPLEKFDHLRPEVKKRELIEILKGNELVLENNSQIGISLL